MLGLVVGFASFSGSPFGNIPISRGPSRARGPPGASGGLPGPPGALEGFWAGLWMLSRLFSGSRLRNIRISRGPSGARGPPGASGGLPGPPGALEGFWGLAGLWMPGLVVFRAPALEISYFQAFF